MSLNFTIIDWNGSKIILDLSHNKFSQICSKLTNSVYENISLVSLLKSLNKVISIIIIKLY